MIYKLRDLWTHACWENSHIQSLRKGGSWDTSHPGPGLGGPGLKGPGRVQVSASSLGVASWHRNQTCLQQKYQSAYSVQVIGCYFCYTAFRASSSGRFDFKKWKMYQKELYLCTEINVFLHFSYLRALILRYSNVWGPTFSEIQKHFNFRERSQSWHTILLLLSNSLNLYEFNGYLGLWSLWLQMTS